MCNLCGLELARCLDSARVVSEGDGKGESTIAVVTVSAGFAVCRRLVRALERVCEKKKKDL